MTALLDVNVLISLLDPNHAFHARAADWLRGNIHAGWASCPISQNGCLRVMSNRSYPNPVPLGNVVERLAEASSSRHHQFWPDDVSLLDPHVHPRNRILSSRQLTDAYLLALAIAHGGRLVTFDTSIPIEVIAGAEPRHLVVL